MNQLQLFAPEELPSRFGRFVQFHRDNPMIYKKFVDFALAGARAGRERFGARMIGERVRWYLNIEIKTDEPFKVNNDFWPYYSRLSMLEHSELEGLFELRLATTDATDEMIIKHCGTD